MKKKFSIAATLAALALTLMGASCGPKHFNAFGKTAFVANQVGHVISNIQKATDEGFEAGIVSAKDAKKITEQTVIAGKAGQDLVAALKAGSAGADDKAKFLAIVRSALKEIPNDLDANTQKLLAPYISLAQTLLTALEV